MKKAAWTAAAFLTSAWTALFPASVSADDLRLPSGEVLPFGAGVNVWSGSDSYFAGKMNGLFESDAFKTSLAQGLIDRGMYKESERAEAKRFAEAAAEIWRDGRAYQLRSASGETMYTAFVFSLPMALPLSETEVLRWQRWAEMAARAGSLSEKERQKLSEHGETAQSFDVIMKAAMAAGQTMKEGNAAPGQMTVSPLTASPLRAGVSKGGVSYRLNFVCLTAEARGMAIPLWIGMLGTTKADGSDLTETLFLADQASGRYFEPVLMKVMEEAK